MTQPRLRIASLLPRSVAHGPGQRFVVWVQGCSLGCAGCFSASTHSRWGGTRWPVPALAEEILATQGIEGVTISGGEPFEQPAALAALLDLLRGTGLTVVCYSGFTLEELRRKRCPHVDRLLAHLDLLIDGRFIAAKSSTLRWRGSNNQQVHFLTNVYDQLRGDDNATSHVELIASSHGLTTTGIWPAGFLQQVRALTRGVKDDAI